MSTLRPSIVRTAALVLVSVVGVASADDDPAARAKFKALLAEHAQAAALDIVASVEQRMEVRPAAGAAEDSVEITQLVVEGEAHLARPAAGWLRTSTVLISSTAAGASAAETGADDASDQAQDAATNESDPAVELFELVGDGKAIHQVDRSTRTVARLGDKWFAVFPGLALVEVWTGRTLPEPESVEFVPDPTGGGRIGLRVVHGRLRSFSTEVYWLDAAGEKLLAAEAKNQLQRTTQTSVYTFRSWRLSKEVDVERYVRMPPSGFADRDVFAQVDDSLLAAGADAPNATLLGLGEDSTELTLESLRGSAVLLVFWFSNCPGCEEDLPRVQALWSELSMSREDVRFVGINLGDEPEAAQAYWRSKGCAYPTYGQRSDEISRAFGVRLYPTTFVLGKDGKVLWRSSGFDEVAVRAILAATR